MEKKFDCYQMVTDKIIALLEKGVIPWARPWTGVQTFAWSRSSGEPYSFLNEMLSDVRGKWLTFKQVQEADG